MSRKNKLVRFDLVCLKCGQIFTIQRKINDLKKVEHIKHLYCDKCMMVQPQYEVRDIVLFILNCHSNGISNLDDKSLIIFNFLSKRVDDEIGKEYRIFKKEFNRR